MAGLDSTGFTTRTLTELIDEFDQTLLSDPGLGPLVARGLANGVLGRVRAVVLALVAELWEVAQAVYNSQSPDSATGAALEAVAALTGTVRDAARPSEVTLTLTGTNATLVPSGSRAAVDEAGDEFETTADATLASLTAWASSTAYTVGQRRSNSSRSYVCVTAGTSAGSGGPTTTASDITDGTAHWRYLGEGTAAVDVEATSVEDGPVVALSGSILDIVTPVSGWSSVINLLDATPGALLETDESLRVRRESEIARAGSSPIPSLRTDLLDVDGVTSVTVFYNTTDVTDADGVPAHGIEALVRGGDDQDIWDQLLASVGGGTVTAGNTAGTATDSEGTVHPMAFSRPDEIEIYVDLVVEYDAGEYPEDGDDQIIAALVAAGDALKSGRNVTASWVSAQAFAVPGVLAVTTVEIGTSSNPTTSTPITISLRELAVFDSSRITVVSSAVTP